MANPWEADEIVRPATQARNPWDEDEIIGEPPPLEIEIRGGTPVPASEFNESANDSDFARLISGKPKESAGGQFGRQVGLGVRAMMGGAYSLPGIVLDPISKATGWFPTAAQSADRHADALGLPEPVSAPERVSGDITSALTGGGGLMGVGRSLATRAPGAIKYLGESLAAMPRTQLASLVGGSGAAGMTREGGGGQGAQMTAGLIGGLGPSFGVAATQAAARGAVRGGAAGREQMQQAIGDFGSVGATPSVGQATGNRRSQGLESLLAGGPTSQGLMSRFADAQSDKIGGGLQKLADRFSRNASAERAGRAIEKGAETFAGNVKATKKALYWQADQFIPESTAVPVANAWQKIVQLTSPMSGAKETTKAMINPKIAHLRDTLELDLAGGGGAIPYAALKRIRSDIGEAMSDFSLSPETPTREYRALYAALSSDMEEAARKMGPQAEQAAKRANNYTRAAADRLEQIQRVIDKNGGPEKVYSAVMSGTQDGGTTLRAVMQSLPPEGQKSVTGAVIKRMGLATPGQQDALGEAFSAQTFLTNWNKVSPEAKRALFDRHGPKFVEDMNKVARIAGTIREGSRVFANPSGTANKAAAYTYAGSLGAALVTGQIGAVGALVGGGITANAMARAMTNPKFVNWLAKATEMPVSALPQQIVLLKAMGKDDPDVAEFAQELEGAEKPN